jgi:hypothetical protein
MILPSSFLSPIINKSFTSSDDNKETEWRLIKCPVMISMLATFAFLSYVEGKVSRFILLKAFYYKTLDAEGTVRAIQHHYNTITFLLFREYNSDGHL